MNILEQQTRTVLGAPRAIRHRHSCLASAGLATLLLHLWATAPLAAAPANALSFDGVNDYVETPTAVIPTTGDFTVECWVVCPTAPNSHREILSQGSSGNAFYIGTDPANNFRVGDTWTGTGVAFPLGGWHHVAVVKSSTNTLLYLDGTNRLARGSAIANPAASGLRFGQQYGSGGEYWPGSVGDVRIWSKALSASEVSASRSNSLTGAEAGLVAAWPFQEGAGTNCTSISASHVVGTLVNGPLWMTPSSDFALAFDGVNDYVETSTGVIPSSGDFTVAFWAQAPTAPSSHREILSQGSSGNGLYIGTDPANNLRLGDSWGTVSPAIPFPVGGWHHFTLVKSTTNTIFYLDGTNRLSRGVAIANPAASTGLRFGRQFSASGGEYWPGNLDDVTIWSKALSDAEVQASLRQTITGTESNLVAYWSFNDLTCVAQGGTNVVGLLVNGPTWIVSGIPRPLILTVTTEAATDISLNSATLNGTVNPGGVPTTAWFEWGATINYGNTTAITNLPATNASLAVRAALNGLTPGLAYHFRLAASNALGLVRGVDQNWLNGREISLAGNGLVIANGQIMPSQADGTYFGAVAPGGVAVTHVFTIRNLGGLPLHLSGSPLVAVSGPHAADFVVTQPSASTVAGSPGSTAFQVAFTPSAPGVRQATLSIASDDNLRNPYLFILQGLGGVAVFDTTSDHLGTITARGQYQAAAQAFDDSAGSKWLDLSPDPSRATWIQYQYAAGASYSLSSYTLTSADDVPARDPAAWVLEGSNDGTNYVSVDSRSGQTFSGRLTKNTYVLGLTVPYHMYRLRILSVLDPGSATSCQIGEIELIGSSGGAPWVTQQPVSLSVLPGMPVSFTVGGDGSLPLSFQWYRSPGAYLAGQTNDTLAWTSVTPNDFGGYFLVLSNAFGSTTSSVAYLSLAEPPAITSQPQGLIVPRGAGASFQVSVSGTVPLWCQWQKGGVSLTNGGNVSGSASTNLALSPTTTNHGGSYTVIITNRYGSVTSSVARLALVLDGGVINDGFETGNFSGWDRSGDLQFTSVTNLAKYRHSGTYSAQLGPVALGYLSQSLPTQAGAAYGLFFWLYCDGKTPNQFLVVWNGTTLLAQTNNTAVGWTNMGFQVVATAASTVLQFGFQNTPSFFGLDDIIVAPLVIPTPRMQVSLASGGHLQFSWDDLNAVPPVSYQVQTSTNLSSTNWLDLGSIVPGGTGTLSVTNPLGSDPQRFYRLLLAP